MNEARWGLMKMRQDMCESSHIGMFGEIQQTQDIWVASPSPLRSKAVKSEWVANPSTAGRPAMKVPGKRGVTPKSQVVFISYTPPLCARDIRATGPAFIRKVQKHWNISLLKYKGPLTLLLAHKLQSASEFQRSYPQSSSWAGIE